MRITLDFQSGRNMIPVSTLWENLPKLDVAKVRNDIPMTNDWIYLDNAATSLTPNPVWEEMARYFLCYNANIERGGYYPAAYATELMYKAHSLIASTLLGCSGHELISTKNMTEGMNMVAYHIAGYKYLNRKNIIISDIEHHSNMLPWIRLAQRSGVELRIIETDNGFINPNKLEDIIDTDTVLVTLQHSSNVTGVVQDVFVFSEICKRNNVLLAIDGSQTVGHMPIDVKAIGCDFFAFSGHKGPMGPVGTGGLYVRGELIEEKIQGFDKELALSGLLGIHKFSDMNSYVRVLFDPMEVGGGCIANVDYDRYVLTESPSRYRAGTPNIVGEIGLGRAAVYVSQQIGLNKICEREKTLTKKLVYGLRELNTVEIYGPHNIENKTGVISFNIKGKKSVEVSQILDSYNICTRSGVHCVMPWHKKNNLLESIGTVRASVHYYNTEDEIDKFIEIVTDISNGKR